MSKTLHHEAFFHRPVREVFDFITTSGHWPKWHPATHAVTGQTLWPGQLGDESTEEMLTAKVFPGRISWRVVSCEAPVRWGIVTTSIDVPLLSAATVRVDYRLVEEERGARLLRTFRYRLPRHLWLLDALYFGARMESESVEALRRLVALIESEQALAA